MKRSELTSETLKEELWDTFKALKAKRIDFHTALALASTSREIMRVIKCEITVQNLIQKKPTQKVLDFTNK